MDGPGSKSVERGMDTRAAVYPRHFRTQESTPGAASNLDARTVTGFGQEWTRFDQSEFTDEELERRFQAYFHIFPWDLLDSEASGFDAGCGTGRWARRVAPRVGTLHCVDASADALAVARRNLSGVDNCRFHLASVDALPLPDGSQEFGYSLGVLHHTPDPERGLAACVAKLKPGAPFLVYLYYALDNRPPWFRGLWRASDALRRIVSRLPFRLRAGVCDLLALTVYWPLSRLARVLQRLGLPVDALPLATYRDKRLYTLRTDALDRFGTRLEHRFTREEISSMMGRVGLVDVRFSERAPYWCAVGLKACR